jgi:hypothetical protein
MSKGSISKKRKKSDALKRHKENEKEEEEDCTQECDFISLTNTS